MLTRRAAAQLLQAAREQAALRSRNVTLTAMKRQKVALAARAYYFQRMGENASMQQVARMYDVPVSSVHRAIQRLRSDEEPEPDVPGARPALSLEEEDFLVLCILKFSSQAMCLGQHDLQQIVDHLTIGPRVCFNRRPLKLTEHWRRGFLRRNANLIAFSHCIPLATQYNVTQELVDELRSNFSEFNNLVDTHGIHNSGIVAVDEVGLTATKSDAAHGRVFHGLFMRPYRTVRIVQARATLLAAIKPNGQCLSPVVVHPHKNVQRKQTEVFDRAAMLDVHAHHVASAGGN